LSDLNDYNELKNIYGKFDLGNLCGVLVSRVAGSEITDRAVADALVRDRLNIRFQVQLHKYIWKDEKGR
jgi:7-carboxy-7-deazaguanine synthase